jgi:hypothetical protein
MTPAAAAPVRAPVVARRPITRVITLALTVSFWHRHVRGSLRTTRKLGLSRRR